MKNFKCLLAYTGTEHKGFRPDIESILQNTLERILQHPITIQAASLTDSGVHAKGQVINFFSDTDNPPERLYASMRGLLPPSIAPLSLEIASPTFHPSLDAKSKEYHYYLCNQPTQLPFHREFSWHCPLPLDLDLMKQGAAHLIGKKDFSSFTSDRYDDPIRHLTAITFTPLPENRLCIKVEGDRFLYKMVRNLVGTLIHIGRGKIALSSLPSILESKDRRLAGVCAPAHGLTLYRVFY